MKLGLGLATTLGRCTGSIVVPPPASLLPLSLSNSSIAENSAAGAFVGAIVNATPGSTLTLSDDAGGRFALSGGDLVTGLAGLDYESAASHAVTIRETLGGATNSPLDTMLTITVTDVAEGGGTWLLSGGVWTDAGAWDDAATWVD